MTFGWTVKPCGNVVCASAIFFEALHGDRGAVLGSRLLRIRRNPAVLEIPRRLSGSPDLLEDALQPLLEARHDLLGILDGDIAAPDQGLCVELAD
jgi:hypothetical protein